MQLRTQIENNKLELTQTQIFAFTAFGWKHHDQTDSV